MIQSKGVMIDLENEDSCLDGDVQIQTNENNNIESGLQLATKELLPYVDVSEEQLSHKLLLLGVKSLEDLKHVQCTDLDGLITLIQFRKFQAQLMQDLQPPVSNSTFNNFYVVPENLFSEKLKNKLNSTVRLEKCDRLAFVRKIGDHLFDNTRPVPKKDHCDKAARVLCEKYPGALSGKLFGKGYEDLATQFFFHVQYLRVQDRKRKNVSVEGPVNNAAKRKSNTGRERYGIPSDRDSPSQLPEGESTASQTGKQATLQQMASLSNIEWQKVETLMAQTFPSQRATINECNMDEILEKWPFLGKHKFLKRHFYFLMNISENECAERLSTVMPKLLRYIRSEADAKKKGVAAKICKALIDFLKKYDEEDRDSENSKALVVTVVLCLGALMTQDMSLMFLHFDENASFDEIQASERLPADGKPIIAVFGENLIQQSPPNCCLIVDRRLLFKEKIPSCFAIISLFMSYFVFKICYPPKLAGLMEFFQRTIFHIEEEGAKSSRTERKKGKTAPPPVNLKYQGLIRNFEDYCSKWSL